MRFIKKNTRINFTNFNRIALLSIIFLSIIPYASLYIWLEAAFCSAILALGVLNILFQNERDDFLSGNYKLFLPLLGLAIYSFWQGISALLISEGVFASSPLLPASFDLTASFWTAVKILVFAVFIKLILDNFHSQIKFLVFGLFATGNFFALFGLFRFLLQNRLPETFDYFLFPQLTPGIGFGTFINQNHFAYLILMTIGLNICLLWWGKLKKPFIYLLVTLSLICITALILTASRGGIISLFGLIAFAIFFPKRNDSGNKNGFSKYVSSLKKLAVFAVVSMILVFGVIFIGKERVVTRFERLPLQIEEVPANASFLRIDVYQATLEMIKDNPVFGVGFGGFRYAVSKYIDISGNIVPEQAHNDYLEFIAGGGLVAVVFGVWFLAVFISKVKRNFEIADDPFALASRIGAICGIVGISIHNLFDFSFQMFANLLFAAALVAIAVHNKKTKKRELTDGIASGHLTGKQFILKSLVIAFFVFLIGYSSLFGFSRLTSAKFNDLSAGEFAELPFDAAVYERKAKRNEKLGKNLDAIDDLKKAIRYRPNDYVLWLELGQIQHKEGQKINAAESFRRAIELAPFYSEPQLFYGKFLVENNEIAEGFKHLHKAFRRNPRYFYTVAGMAWEETGKNGAETIKLLSPLNVYEAAMLNIYFYDIDEFSMVVEVTCRHKNLPQAHRDVLVQKLLEKRQYYFAQNIYRRICGKENTKVADFENGDFKTDEIYEGIGFGWRVNNLPDEVTLSVEKRSPNSLKINFKGNYDPVLPVISQLLIVEQNERYRISFSYKTEKIVTGGVPVLLFIPKGQDADGNFTEVPLTSENGGWIQKSVEINTDDSTEAIEVRLARKTCGQELCPIFGSLEIAGFSIRKMQ